MIISKTILKSQNLDNIAKYAGTRKSIVIDFGSIIYNLFSSKFNLLIINGLN